MAIGAAVSQRRAPADDGVGPAHAADAHPERARLDDRQPCRVQVGKSTLTGTIVVTVDGPTCVVNGWEGPGRLEVSVRRRVRDGASTKVLCGYDIGDDS